MNNILEKFLWSCSLISASDNTVYGNRKYGLIYNAEQTKFTEAFKENLFSGSKKNLQQFKAAIFSLNYKGRLYVRNALINELRKKDIKISEKEYKELAKYLYNKKYLTQIKEDIRIGNKIIKAETLRECLEKSRDKLFISNQTHNEIDTLNSIPSGLIAMVDKIEDCSNEFLTYAKENNLPIILMKSNS